LIIVVLDLPVELINGSTISNCVPSNKYGDSLAL
jgi:hypothetical protein